MSKTHFLNLARDFQAESKPEWAAHFRRLAERAKDSTPCPKRQVSPPVEPRALEAGESLCSPSRRGLKGEYPSGSGYCGVREASTKEADMANEKALVETLQELQQQTKMIAGLTLSDALKESGLSCESRRKICEQFHSKLAEGLDVNELDHAIEDAQAEEAEALREAEAARHAATTPVKGVVILGQGDEDWRGEHWSQSQRALEAQQTRQRLVGKAARRRLAERVIECCGDMAMGPGQDPEDKAKRGLMQLTQVLIQADDLGLTDDEETAIAAMVKRLADEVSMPDTGTAA